MLTLALVSAPEEDDLAGAVTLDGERVAVAGAWSCGGLAAEFCDAALEVGLHVVRALVFGDHGQHALEAGQALLVGLGLAVGLLGCQVFGCQVRWHGSWAGLACASLFCDQDTQAAPRCQ